MQPEAKAPADVEATARIFEKIRHEVHKAVVGQDEVLELLLVGLIAGGHVLLEGVPGVAKTLMVRAVARSLSATFRRIQFTPDLMPSDVLGTRVFDLDSRTFSLTRGPIFTDILLADEVNRAPPKVQSALLDAMQERSVTLDGENHDLPAIFTFFATLIPFESEGTYPLPEAQLDRFLFKVAVGYPSIEEEDRILELAHHGMALGDLDKVNIEATVSVEEVLAAREALHAVEVRDVVRNYLRQLVVATRTAPEVRLGAGPRAAVHLLLCTKAVAALAGRDFVTPDDVRRLVLPTLAHRLLLTADAEVDGIQPEEVLQRILDEVEVPR